MLQKFITEQHYTDEHGNPTGGHTVAIGLAIDWQNGPLGRGADRREPNGAFVETVIQAAIRRLEFYEQSKFACIENEAALGPLRLAMEELAARTANRERREVEGTHTV